MPTCLVPRSSTTIYRFLLLSGHPSCYFSTRQHLMPPTPPLEKKWFYKEVWSALQPKAAQPSPRNLSQECQKPNPPSTVAFKDLPRPPVYWSQHFETIRDRGLKLAEQYGVRNKLAMAFQQYCHFVTMIKDFFCQGHYKQMGTLLDTGLKRLENKIRITREGRQLGHEDSEGKQKIASIKMEDAVKSDKKT